ncbi:MAG: NBR1-Ig-like domain-containing protein [Anaerolineales bacterium]
MILTISLAKARSLSKNTYPDECVTINPEGVLVRFGSLQKVVGSFLLAFFLFACAFPSSQEPTQELDPFSPQILGTAIVETAAVAQTQTAAFLPPTLTPTLTKEATSTIIAAPLTATPFSLFTPTSEFVIPLETTDPSYAVTAGATGLGNLNDPDYVKYTGQPWTCGLRSITPRGGIIKGGTSFYAYFTIVNTGTKVWTSNTVDFLYKSGLKQEDQRIQDLSSTVGPGSLVTFKVLFKAPKSPGSYASIWTLKVGSRFFCGMKMSFDVPK